MGNHYCDSSQISWTPTLGCMKQPLEVLVPFPSSQRDPRVLGWIGSSPLLMCTPLTQVGPMPLHLLSKSWLTASRRPPWTNWRGQNTQGNSPSHRQLSPHPVHFLLCLSSLLRHTLACFVFTNTKHYYSKKKKIRFIYWNLKRITLDKCGLNCPLWLYRCLFFARFVSFCGLFFFFSIHLC